MVMLDDQNYAVRLFDDRNRVGNNSQRRRVKNYIIKRGFNALYKIMHITAGKKLGRIRWDSAIGDREKIIHICFTDDLLLCAFAVEEIRYTGTRINAKNIVYLRTSEVAVDDQNLCVDLLCQRDSDIDRGDRFALAL